MSAGVLSLVGICGLYAEVSAGSTGTALAVWATLALLSGFVASLFGIALLSERTDFSDPDDDGRGDVPGSVPPPSPDGGAALRWQSFERDFRQYAGRQSPAHRRLEPTRAEVSLRSPAPDR